MRHFFPVPVATYDARSWRRWLFDQLLRVELHEACEFFRLEDRAGTADRPFAPHHGPGRDPYTVFEVGSELNVRTSFRGTVNP